MGNEQYSGRMRTTQPDLHIEDSWELGEACMRKYTHKLTHAKKHIHIIRLQSTVYSLLSF